VTPTLVKHVAQRTIVQYHNLTEIWFHRAQVFDKGALPKCTMLAVVAA
jgi:hypothetical protein